MFTVRYDVIFSNVYKRNIGFRISDRSVPLPAVCSHANERITRMLRACVRSFSSKTAMFNVLKLCSSFGCNFAQCQSIQTDVGQNWFSFHKE